MRWPSFRASLQQRKVDEVARQCGLIVSGSVCSRTYSVFEVSGSHGTSLLVLVPRDYSFEFRGACLGDLPNAPTIIPWSVRSSPALTRLTREAVRMMSSTDIAFRFSLEAALRSIMNVVSQYSEGCATSVRGELGALPCPSNASGVGLGSSVEMYVGLNFVFGEVVNSSSARGSDEGQQLVTPSGSAVRWYAPSCSVVTSSEFGLPPEHVAPVNDLTMLLGSMNMLRFHAVLLSAGVDTCQTLAGCLDCFSAEHLKSRFGFQVGHMLKLHRWRHGARNAGQTSSDRPRLYDILHRHGLLKFWSSLVDGGVDEFEIFDALTEHDLYSFGFREGHLVKWFQLKQAVAFSPQEQICSDQCPCSRRLCGRAARGAGKVCNNPDPIHHTLFCHNRAAHHDRIFSQVGKHKKKFWASSSLG